MSVVSSGYSGKTVVQKLGIRPGEAVRLVSPPTGYRELLGELPMGARLVRDGPELGFVHLFARTRAALEGELPLVERKLDEDGVVWVSWPKRASKVETDLTDIVVREVGLKHGLVDVKVCSIDATWSALKFVRRKTDRRALPKHG
jgi:hypothetical protein